LTEQHNAAVMTEQGTGKEAFAAEQTTSDLLYDLEQYRTISREVVKLLEAGDYTRVKVLLESRGEILNRMHVLSGGRQGEIRLSKETRRQCRLMYADIELSAGEFSRVKSEKESDLLTRLHQLKMLQLNQLYKKQV
jgi:hypothetical protein